MRDGPQLHYFNYNWDRTGSPYKFPALVVLEADNIEVYQYWDKKEEDDPNFYVIDVATGSYGQVQRSFGRKQQVGFIPGSGIPDNTEVYHLEVKVIKPARKAHHKEGDIVIWMKPCHLCTAEEHDAFDF